MQYRARTRAPVLVRSGPASGALVERRRGHPRAEPDVAPQVVPIRDMVGVAQDLRLGGVALAPLPFLLQRAVELERVLHALDVAACAGIAVPVPGAADPVGLLVHAGGEPQPAQPVQQVEAREACPDDGHVQGFVTFRRLGPEIGSDHGCSVSLSMPLRTAPRETDNPGPSGHRRPMAGAVEAAAADRATVRGMYRCAASPVAAESGRVPSPYLTVWVASRTQPLGDQELSRPLKDPSLPELEFEAHAAGAGG